MAVTLTQPERELAIAIAHRWLELSDNHGRLDPDGDQCMVARQFLRALEELERLKEDRKRW